MENYVSLMILLIAFMGLMLLVAYVADALASKLVKWLGLEDVDNEYKNSHYPLANEDKMVEGMNFLP